MSSLLRSGSDRSAVASRLTDVLAAIDAGVLLLSRDGTVREANPAAIRLVGPSIGEIEGRSLDAIFGPVPRGGLALVESRGEGSGTRVLEVERRSLPGGEGEEVCLVRERSSSAADALARIAKLDETLRALGVISHKINNPLTALLGRAQILRIKTKGDPSLEKTAEVIEESAARAADLARELSKVLKDSRAESVDQILASESRAGSAVSR